MLFITQYGCGTNPNIEGRLPFEVKKLSEIEYEIEFYGTPLNTLDEAKEQWNYKAESICNGAYKYRENEADNECLNADILSCIFASDKLVSSGPVAKGIAICPASDEPKVIYSNRDNNVDSTHANEILIVKQIKEEVFFIEYAGLPSTTIEDAREIWFERAALTCGTKKYSYNLSKNSMWQQDIKATGKGISVEYHDATSSDVLRDMYCSTGGAIECMFASLMHSFASRKSGIEYKESKNTTYDEQIRFPVVEGRLICD